MNTNIDPGLLECYEFMNEKRGRGEYGALRSAMSTVLFIIVAAVVTPIFHNVVVDFVLGAIATACAVTLVVMLRVVARAATVETFDAIKQATLTPCATALCNRKVYYNAALGKYLHLGAGTECSTTPLAMPAAP